MARLRGAKYKRISDDREGRELGVIRQDEDLEALATRLDIDVVGDYTDNDIGASTRSSKKRPRYDAMMADARAGAFDVIIAYTSGRLTRRPREHEDLIELAEQHGIRFQYVASPSFDLNTSAGRRIARILAANDAGEAEDIAERVSRAARQRAERGEFHGGHPTFGYQKSSGSAPIEAHPEHAEWIREGIRRLLAGETLYGVCLDWNAKGRRTDWPRWERDADGGFAHDDRGKRIRRGERAPWYPRTLKRVLTSAAVAGYREYDGQLHEAMWKPIVDRDDWRRLRTLLWADDRKASNWQMAGNGNARKYELSGLVFCAGTMPDGSRCGQVMVSMLGNRKSSDDVVTRHSFTCNKLATGGCGSMRIEMHHLEAYIEEQLFAVVDTPELWAAMAAQGHQVDDAEKALRSAIANDEDALRRVTEDYDDGDIPRPEYRRRRARIEQRLQANRRNLPTTTRSRLHAELSSGHELRDRWPHKDNVWKRTILSAVIERIEVSRHPVGMATNLTRRRNEPDDAFKIRLDRHRAEVLRQRVTVRWLY